MALKSITNDQNKVEQLSSGEVQFDIKALTAVGNGQKTVSTAGSAEVLASATTIKSVTIKALAGNTGSVFVGDSGVTSSNGFILAKGDVVSLDVSDLNTIYLDVSVNGEGVSYIYLI